MNLLRGQNGIDVIAGEPVKRKTIGQINSRISIDQRGDGYQERRGPETPMRERFPRLQVKGDTIRIRKRP